MSTILELPDGGTATFRDPKQVSERHRRPVARLQQRLAASAVGQLLASKDAMSDEQFEAEARKLLASDEWELLDDLNDALVVALVESWSYERPVSLDGLLDLPSAVYDALRAEASKHVADLLPSFDVSPEESSPTQPSAA